MVFWVSEQPLRLIILNCKVYRLLRCRPISNTESQLMDGGKIIMATVCLNKYHFWQSRSFKVLPVTLLYHWLGRFVKINDINLFDEVLKISVCVYLCFIYGLCYIKRFSYSRWFDTIHFIKFDLNTINFIVNF